MPSPSGPNAYPSAPGNYPSAPNIQSAGTAILAATATLGGPAQLTEQAGTGLAAAGSLGGSTVVGGVATSTLAATAGLGGNAGVPTGAATLAATGGLSGTGVGVTSGGALLAAVGALAGTPVPPGTSAALAAAAGFAGSGPTATESAGATLAAAAGLGPSVVLIEAAGVTLTATAALGSAPTPLESAAATLTAVAALVAAGVAGPTSTVTLTATGTLSGAITTATVVASAVLAATAGLAASGTGIHQPAALPALAARATLLLTVSGGGFDAPTLWNPTPYDLVDGSGTIYPAGTTRAWPATPYVRRAVLAGLLVTIDGYRFTGFGNPGAPQRDPQMAGLTPTREDRRTVGAGQSQPVDATLASRTVLLPPAAVGVVCEVTKVDQTAYPVTATPHGPDSILGASPVLTVQGGAVRLFGAVDGGWVAVPVDQRVVAGEKRYTAPVTVGAGQTVTGGQTVDTATVTGASTVQGPAALRGGATILGGASVTGGQTVAGGLTSDTALVTGTTALNGGATVTGGLTSDIVTSSGWKLARTTQGNFPGLLAAEADVQLVALNGRLYSADSTNNVARDMNAGVYYGNSVSVTGLLSGTGLQAGVGDVRGGHFYGAYLNLTNNLTCDGIAAGNVGFNNVTAFQVSASGAMYSPAYKPYSDATLKHSIEHLNPEHAGELLDQLQPREFDWRAQPERGRTLGFVAQEMPDRLRYDAPPTEEGGAGLLTYDLVEVLAATVAVVQQQRAQIEALTARVDALEERVPEC